ncbi:MAG: hypothetical protein GF411_18670 [Candidatus Lokiarchaeota archaeon]|nr:hypothetical protein [Candidatus Lokiarchaeota archaeon]
MTLEEPLTNGTYHFRVRSFNIYQAYSTWSNVENITIEVPSSMDTTKTTIPYGGLLPNLPLPDVLGLPDNVAGIDIWYLIIGGVLVIVILIAVKKRK